MSDETVQDAIHYLEREVLRNIVPLKMMTAFIRLTGSLGLTHFLGIEHWITK